MPIPAACQGIADEIAGLEAERTDLQLELQQAPTNQKAGLARQIKAINGKLLVARNQLVDCLATQPKDPPPPPPLEAQLAATVTLTTTKPEAPGPYQMPVVIGVILNGARTFISLTSFPDVATSFDTPVGRNTTTVSRSSGGSGSYSGGEINIPVTLHFDQSIDLPFIDEDSDLPLVLSTSAPGSPVDAGGQVSLVGTGAFVGGFLAGANGTISIDGRFTPAP